MDDRREVDATHRKLPWLVTGPGGSYRKAWRQDDIERLCAWSPLIWFAAVLGVLLVIALATRPSKGATAVVTAYCDSLRPMADGATVHVGACAGPRCVALGTVVLIDGRRYTVEDRTAKRYDGRYDLWMPGHRACLQFGIRRLSVVIVGRTGR